MERWNEAHLVSRTDSSRDLFIVGFVHSLLRHSRLLVIPGSQLQPLEVNYKILIEIRKSSNDLSPPEALKPQRVPCL